jgi:hypothetical protein
MDTYVHYSLGRKDGIESAVFENLPSLIRCMENCRSEYPEEFNESIYEMALKMNINGSSSLEVNTEKEAYLIDRVVDELVYYEDLSSVTNVEFKLFESLDSSMMKWYRYADNLRNVIPNCSDYSSEVYRKLLFDGMSIAKLTGHKYQSDDGVYRIAWVLPEEIDQLVSDLEPINAVTDWKDDEQSGVFFIYDALKKAKEKGCALVVEIA